MHVLDTSAFMKLLLPEQHHVELRTHLRSATGIAASQLLAIEAGRVIRRVDPALLPETDRILSRIQLLPIDGQIVATASRLAPPELRSLDAIHLATAISLSDYDPTLITYDRGLATAAEAAGIPVTAPAIAE